MDLSKLFRNEQKGLLKSAKKIKTPRRSIIDSLKSKSKSFIISLFTAIVTATSSFGAVSDVQIKVDNVMQRFSKGEITAEQVASEFPGIMQDLERHVQEDIESRNYNQAIAYLRIYRALADRLNNRELKAEIDRLLAGIREARVTHIDINKRGIYTDNNKIYFIGIQGGFRSDESWTIERIVRNPSTYLPTELDMLRQAFPDLFGPRISVTLREHWIVKIERQGPENNPTIKFVAELGSLGNAQLDSTVISRLSPLPFN